MVRLNVKQTVADLLRSRAELSSGDLARQVGISRQAAHAHLIRLVKAGVLERIGAGRGTRYRRARTVIESTIWKREGLEEHAVWGAVESRAAIRRLRPNVASIMRYGLTEMVNNAIEHSSGNAVSVQITTVGDAIGFDVADDGVGIFAHVMATRGLRTPFEAIAELQKGKVTTMPEAHSGEGIFFTSKVADKLTIESGSTKWIIDTARDDQSVETAPHRPGTFVRFEVDRETTRTTEEVFGRFTDDDLGFSRTRTSIRLFREGEEIVSRSEAKRLLAGLEKFQDVVLDFRDVRGIGQGFADEVFRVWQQAHPDTTLSPTNANAAVRFMIDRALASSSAVTSPRAAVSLPTVNVTIGTTTKTSS